MLIEFATGKTIEELDHALREAAARHKFGVLAMHDLQATMQSKGADYGHACRVYEVCNPFHAKRVLDTNPAISTALPCRISVYEQDGQLRVSTLQPTLLIQMYGNPELAPVAQEVEQSMSAMMREAAGVV